jgi:hypothetical protein
MSGGDTFQDGVAKIESAIEAYNASLQDLSVILGVEIHTQVIKTHSIVADTEAIVKKTQLTVTQTQTEVKDLSRRLEEETQR